MFKILKKEKSPKNKKEIVELIKENDYIKVTINENISSSDFRRIIEEKGESNTINLINANLLWTNGLILGIKKGTCYIIKTNDALYNILLTDEEIAINERRNKELDKETGKRNITESKTIYYYTKKNSFRYTSFKDDEHKSTYYTKYYDKSPIENMNEYFMTEDEAIKEIEEIFSRLKDINKINMIIELPKLEENIIPKKNCRSKVRKKKVS